MRMARAAASFREWLCLRLCTLCWNANLSIVVQKSRAIIAVGVVACGIAVCASGMSCSSGDRWDEPHGDCFPRPTPACGSECYNPCGSGCAPCPYAPDVKWCSDGKVVHCRDSWCVEVVETCTDADACVASGCARSPSDCIAVREAYEVEVGRSAVAAVREGSGGLSPGEYGQTCPHDCAVAAGDCDAGLETCWLIGGRTPEIDRLAGLYKRLGCSSSAACDCPSLKVQVSCRGISSPDGAFLYNGCVAQ